MSGIFRILFWWAQVQSRHFTCYGKFIEADLFTQTISTVPTLSGGDIGYQILPCISYRQFLELGLGNTSNLSRELLREKEFLKELFSKTENCQGISLHPIYFLFQIMFFHMGLYGAHVFELELNLYLKRMLHSMGIRRRPVDTRFVSLLLR